MAQLRTVEAQQEVLSAGCPKPKTWNRQSASRSSSQGFPDIDLAVESLADARSQIELTNVRHERDRTFATIFVPSGKLTAVEAKLTAYMEERKDSAGRPRDHRTLVDAIASFPGRGLGRVVDRRSSTAANG
jgi:hypothetical protein